MDQVISFWGVLNHCLSCGGSLVWGESGSAPAAHCETCETYVVPATPRGGGWRVTAEAPAKWRPMPCNCCDEEPGPSLGPVQRKDDGDGGWFVHESCAVWAEERVAARRTEEEEEGPPTARWPRALPRVALPAS